MAKRTERSLDREQRRHWDGRKCDEYIITTQGCLPYCATPEEQVCPQETLDEILAVLALCTPSSGSGSCSMRYTISAMRKLGGCMAAPRPQSMRVLRAFGKVFQIFPLTALTITPA